MRNYLILLFFTTTIFLNTETIKPNNDVIVNKYYKNLQINDEKDINYKKHKRLLRSGIVMLATGTSMSMLALPNFLLTREYNKKERDNSNFTKTNISLPSITKSIMTTGIGNGFFCLGITLDLISIASFKKSAKFYKKYNEDYNKNFSMDLLLNGFKEPSVGILLTYKF